MKIIGLILLGFALVAGGWWVGKGPAPTAPAPEKNSQATESMVKSVKESPLIPASATFEVYQGISIAKNSRVLDLSGRGLSGSLKAEVRQLTELEKLNISDNNFTGLPAEVGQLTKLKELDLSNNPLTGLPYELGNLSNLQLLDLSGTQYAKQDLAVIQEKLPASVKVITE
jgi:Leucine-rich repeat (LRR) protein